MFHHLHLGVLAGLIFSCVGLFLLYWVIRLGVRHGIEDAWRRRAQRAAEVRKLGSRA